MDILGRFFMAIFGVLLGIIVPVMALFARTDDMIQKYVENATNVYVDEAKQMGYITPESYKAFARKLNNTGYLYNVTMEHGSIVAYPDDSTTGEYRDYYMIQNKNDILSTMFPTSSTTENDYIMKSGDELNIVIELKEPTLSARLTKAFTLSPHAAQKTIRYSYGVTIGNTKR